MSGPRLAHYELEAKIGEGGMGVVYRARDTRLDRPVAIKILPRRVHRDPEWRARFLREARAAARLNHPNLATIYEIDEADAPPALFGDTEPLTGAGAVSVLYIAMEFIEGEDLKTRLLGGSLDESEVVNFALQITRGLEAAHRAGIVHRDLKPHNLRVTPEGVVKILDFGLAKMLHAAQKSSSDESTLLTTAGMVLGTAPYMSPEQVAGETVDARSDLFSLGVVLYEMAGGKVPYEGPSLVSYVRNLTRTEAEPLSKVRPGVSRGLEAVVAQLLEKEPDARYDSAAAVREDLEALVTGSIVSAPGRRVRVFRKLRASRGVVWGVAAGLLLALAGVLAWQSLRPDPNPPVESVAVLPFENQTSNPELDAYYEGIGTALIRTLSRISGLNVVPELDVRRYRDTEKTVEEIAEELDVGTLIRGYVQGGGEEILVGVEVLSSGVTTPLWNRPFEGNPDDLLTLQERIADVVLRSLPVSLSQRERERLRNNPTESREAWNAYFRGLANLEQVDDRDALERAVEYFERAVEADPEFAWAYGGLSEALWWLYRARKDPVLLDRAEGSIERAVQLAPDQPELWIDEARVLRSRDKHQEAIEAIQKALEINPDLGSARQQLAITQWDAGNPEAAKENYQRALELQPSSWSHWNEYGTFLMERNEFGEAEAAFRRAQELASPDVYRPLENLGTLALSENDLEKALEAYEAIPLDQRTATLRYNMAALYWFAGEIDQAKASVLEAIEARPQEPTFHAFLGDLRNQAHDTAAAKSSYRKAFSQVESQLAVNPGNLGHRALRVYLLARLGACPRMRQEAQNLEQGSELPTELRISVARAYSVCGDTEATRSSVRALLEDGVSPGRIRSEVELANYL